MPIEPDQVNRSPASADRRSAATEGSPATVDGAAGRTVYGAPARLLALQRSVGNRAVGQLLARQGTTDPFMRRAHAFLRKYPRLDAMLGGGPGAPGRAASEKALRDIFARTGGAAVSPRPGRYLPGHTRAHAQELKTLVEYAENLDVARIDLVPSSRAGRTPDMLVTTRTPTHGPRVEITTLTGAGPGYQARGAAGAKPPTEEAIIGRVREKVRPSRGRPSQLAAPMTGVRSGGTLVVRMPYADAASMGHAQRAMDALAHELQGATHVEAIEFHGPGGESLRFERQASGAYVRGGAQPVMSGTAHVRPLPGLGPHTSSAFVETPDATPHPERKGRGLGTRVLGILDLSLLGLDLILGPWEGKLNRTNAEMTASKWQAKVAPQVQPVVDELVKPWASDPDRRPREPIYFDVMWKMETVEMNKGAGAAVIWFWRFAGMRPGFAEVFHDIHLTSDPFHTWRGAGGWHHGDKPRVMEERIVEGETHRIRGIYHTQFLISDPEVWKIYDAVVSGGFDKHMLGFVWGSLTRDQRALVKLLLPSQGRAGEQVWREHKEREEREEAERQRQREARRFASAGMH
jgi:hypothetical protein